MNGGGLRKVDRGLRGSDFPLAVPIHALITVGNVEEKVLFMMLLRKNERKKEVFVLYPKKPTRISLFNGWWNKQQNTV